MGKDRGAGGDARRGRFGHGGTMSTVGGGGMAPVAMVATVTTIFLKTPLPQISLFAKRSPSSFSGLIGAFRHFLKFCKNLCGLPIISRSTTKICVVK